MKMAPLLAKFQLKIIRSSKISTFDGINISNLTSGNKFFEKSIVPSLELIKRLSPGQYNVVKKEIKWLVNSNLLIDVGQYRKESKLCVIKYIYLSDDIDFNVAFYSGVIVHEATHGALFSKNIDYSGEKRVLHERICTFEENKFYQKVELEYPAYKGLLVHEFKAENWSESWEISQWKVIYYILKKSFSLWGVIDLIFIIGMLWIFYKMLTMWFYE